MHAWARPLTGRLRRRPQHVPMRVRGHVEVQRFVAAVDDDRDVEFVLAQQAHRERADRRVEPVAFHRRRAVRQQPLDATRWLEQPQLTEAREEVLVVVDVERLAHRDESRDRLHPHVFGRLRLGQDPIPVEPGDVVVLAVRVVVAALRVVEFVAGEHHRRAEREHQRAEHVHARAFAQQCHMRVVARPLDAEVRAVVGVRAVVVVFAVRLVVLRRVLREVGERETVVRRHEVDRRRRAASRIGREQVR